MVLGRYLSFGYLRPYRARFVPVASGAKGIKMYRSSSVNPRKSWSVACRIGAVHRPHGKFGQSPNRPELAQFEVLLPAPPARMLATLVRTCQGLLRFILALLGASLAA